MSETPEEDRELSFLEHLVELRGRLLKACLSIVVVLIILLPFSRSLYEALASPLMAQMPEGSSMIAIDVASPFLVAPALFKHEKRLARPLLLSSVFLFYAGCAFAYFVVFPLMFGFFSSVAPEGVAVMTDISKYLSFVMTLFLAFGITFEVPIATIILVATGITTTAKLASWRPYIIVGAFALGMVLTPPDIISQTLLALPMWLLFELGIIFSRILVREKEATGDAETDQATS